MTRLTPLGSRPLPAALLVAAALLAVAACDERTPTSVDVTPLPPEPVTVEVEFPWDDFASNLAVYGGYSGPEALEESIVARAFAGTLDARTLIRWGAFPTAASVRDSTGTLRTDLNISIYSGYVVAYIDVAASTNTGPVTLGLGALQNEWHAPSTTWTSAVDTLGEQRAWPEAGAGPVTPLATRDWNPAEGDSVQFFVDSATIAAWRDPADPGGSSARIELLTDGHRLRIVGGALRLETRSSIDPDTVLILTAAAAEVTLVYTPAATPPADGMRVGGAPAWRTVFDIAIPTALTGPPALCASVGCPFTIGPQHVSYAGLALRSRRTEDAYQPTDSVALDVRPVLSRAALPKSPLGGSLLADPLGQRVGPEPFATQEGSLVEIPISAFVRGYLAGPDPSGRPPPGTLALLSATEPEGFTFASFFGPGGVNEPVLKLILTVSPPMELQ